MKIPDGLADVEPYGCDESAPADNGQSDEKCGSDSEPNRDPKARCGSDSEPEVHRMCTGNAPEVHRKGNPFLPIPIPNPKEEKAASGESPSASKNGKAKTPKFDPGAIEIPPPLQTDRFLAAWREWVTHRREIKKPLTPTATTQQIRRLAEWGESRSVAAIEHTVGNGWVGLREPDVSRNGTPPPPSGTTLAGWSCSTHGRIAMSSRPPMFAAKVIRVLTRSAAAQELGPNVCWMLTVILGQEDSPAVRYSRPVTYYFEQLMPLCGFRSPKQLRAAIKKAVETGWLDYTPGAKGRPGRFRVKIPDELADVEPYGCDESDPPANGKSDEKCVSESEANRAPKTKCVSESEAEAEMKRAPKRKRKGNPFLPIPIPNPKEEKAASGESPSASKNGKAKSPKFDPLSIEFPPPLRTDRFLAAWREWVTHRREIKKPLTPTATTQQIRRLAEWGESRSVAAIEHTVGNGWVGLREPDVSRNGTPPPSSPSVPDRRPVTLAELRAQGERP